MKLGEIGLGRRIADYKSGTVFRIAGNDHYGKGITTLLSEYIIAVHALDAAEAPGKRETVFEKASLYGSNCYPESNLHQWLTSKEESWFRPAHEQDLPPEAQNLRYGEMPYADEAGFLARFSDAFLDHMVETQIPVLVRTGKLKAELASVKTAVFLPSRTEMNKGDELGIAEGKPLPLFYDHCEQLYKAKPLQMLLERYGRSWNPGDPARNVKLDEPQIYDPKYGWWYYMRTPNTMYNYLERVMSPYGAVSYTFAYNDIVGVRPLVNMDAGMEIYDIGEGTPLYCIG